MKPLEPNSEVATELACCSLVYEMYSFDYCIVGQSRLAFESIDVSAMGSELFKFGFIFSIPAKH